MLVGTAHAQNDMRKRFEERRAERRARYEQKRSEQQKRFDEFRRKQNERYVRQLRNKWKQYEVLDEVQETPRKDSVTLKQYQAEILSPELDTKAYDDVPAAFTATTSLRTAPCDNESVFGEYTVLFIGPILCITSPFLIYE